MPLSINVGLSRKASKDYQSTGVSINVTAELDHALLARPEDLQQQIHGLYSQARQALERQASPPSQRPSPAHNGNGREHRGNDQAPMTASQRRALLAIAKRLESDAGDESQRFLGVPFDDLSLRQASELIDHLKAQPSSTRR
jgi:hypothetical protein